MCEILKKLQGKTAEQLLIEYGMQNDIPMDIEKLLRKIGIEVLPAPFEDIEEEIGLEKGDILGATLINDEAVTIFYRKEFYENRRKFIIAHELAHCCLHADSSKATHIQLRRESEENSLLEGEASVFAGQLLIPEKHLKAEHDKFIVPSLRALAEIFEVSTSVMGARMDYLNMPYYKDVQLSEG